MLSRGLSYLMLNVITFIVSSPLHDGKTGISVNNTIINNLFMTMLFPKVINVNVTVSCPEIG